MRLRAAAFAAFFLSGASSLVFQTIWSRLLSHVFGSSSIAISSVVSVFMAGLGLGAWLFGRRADRIRDPLLVYALAETGVGLAALCVPFLVRPSGLLADVNALLRNSLGAESPLFMAGRFLCIVPVLLVPTVLMGATLPLLARHFVAEATSPTQASREVGRLYTVNTLGAVAGVLLGTFVLLPRFGVSVANAGAACTNFALALLIVVLRRWSSADTARDAQTTPRVDVAKTSADVGSALPIHMRRAAAIGFACSGFASLLYEVVWSRALINTIGGSLYSFALILTTFLVGIALGSALATSLANPNTRPLLPSAWASALLCLVACGPFLAHAGLTIGALVALGSVASVVLYWLFARGQARRVELLDATAELSAERRPALFMLAVPVAIAAAAWSSDPSRLARITLSVVLSSVTLCALLMVLRQRLIVLLVALQLFIASATFASDLFADDLSLTFASMVAPLYDVLPNHVATVQALMFATAALCVLPSALAMGAVFPVTLRAWTAGGADIGRDVGVVYTGNTLGSIAGAWLPGFVLMPGLGMQATLHVGIATNLLIALGLSLAFCLRPRARDGSAEVYPLQRTERAVFAGSAAIVPWLIALLCLGTLRPPEFFAWNISKMTLGAFRISLARDVLDEESWGAPDLVYYHDGLSTTVTVERWGRHFSLKNNGKVDASNGDDMPTQIMVAALPLLMHQRGPRDLDLAIVGFGSGVTVGAALRFPVRSADVVELERSTIEASRFFADVNHLRYELPRFPYVREPRLHVINDDGRNYLAATPKRFDVIVSEPSNPWLTGVSDLFTIDHFRISKRKLKPGGIYCQWAQLYEISPENVKIIYRTFASMFRYVVVFSAEDLSSDTILIGSDDPLPLDLSRVRRAMQEPQVSTELERAYIHSPYDVFARVLLANKAEVLRFTQGAPLNTDDNARIELSAPRDLIGFERYKGYLETMYAPSWPYAHLLPELRGFDTGTEGSNNYAQQALALIAHGRKTEARTLLAASSAEGPSESQTLVNRMAGLLGPSPAEPTPLLAADATPNDASIKLQELLRERWIALQAEVQAGRYKQALVELERVPAHLRRELGGDWAYAEGFLLYRTNDAEAALDVFEDLVRSDAHFAATHPEFYYFLARCHDALMHFDKAVRNMRVYVESRAFDPGSAGHP